MCHALCHALRINCTGKNLAHGDQRIGKVSFNTPNPNLGLRGPSAQRKKRRKKYIDDEGPTTETPVQHSLTATGYLIIISDPLGGELQRPLGNRVSQRLRDHGLGARAAIWTRQSAIHATHHATRATTTPPTHVGGDLQCPLGTAGVSQRMRDQGRSSG